MFDTKKCEKELQFLFFFSEKKNVCPEAVLHLNETKTVKTNTAHRRTGESCLEKLLLFFMLPQLKLVTLNKIMHFSRNLMQC